LSKKTLATEERQEKRMIRNSDNFTQLDMPEAEVYYAPHFFTKEESGLYLQRLTKEVDWQQEEIKMFGKQAIPTRGCTMRHNPGCLCCWN
jgi:hypothetical protein